MTDLITLSPFISVSLFEEYQSFRSDRIFLGNSVSSLKLSKSVVEWTTNTSVREIFRSMVQAVICSA